MMGIFILYYMAKDLPYFKFFCSEWNDGDITLESYEAQGLFINICSYYWSNNCDVTLTKLKKKFKKDCIIEELIKSETIKVINDIVIINFLNEQLTEREENSTKKSAAGKASAESKKLAKLTQAQQLLNTSSTENQHVLNLCSTENQLLREEERREEEIRKDNKAKPLTLDNDFNLFWNKYNKKIDSKKCKDKFHKLSKTQVETILKVVDSYVAATSDVQYRKNPLTWLNGECWKDVEVNTFLPTKDKPFGKSNQL